MTKAELILKVVMSPEEPESAFVDQFLRLLPESDLPEFQKILEMKVKTFFFFDTKKQMHIYVLLQSVVSNSCGYQEQKLSVLYTFYQCM